MTCFLCNSSKKLFFYQCVNAHPSICSSCAPCYLKTCVTKLFREKINQDCLFCLRPCCVQKIDFRCRILNPITLSDIGLHGTNSRILDKVMDEYMFDFLVDLNDGVNITTKQLRNTLTYWNGIQNMLKKARRKNPPENVLKAIENLLHDSKCYT